MKQVAGRAAVGLEQLVGHWVLDGSLSTVRFTHRTIWGLVKVKGRFAAFSGSGVVEPGGNVAGSVSVEAASLETNNRKRDEHLRSSDFFDVERFPQITVEVSAVRIRGDVADIRATLAIREVREPITLTANLKELTADHLRLEAEAKVDREAFGMTWNRMGTITGQATILVDAVFHRSAD